MTRQCDDCDVYPLSVPGMQVDDVQFIQPVGFVWFQKPRYRVKAITRKQGN